MSNCSVYVKMTFNKLLYLAVFTVYVFRIKYVNCLVSSQIPSQLVYCYNGSFTMEDKPPFTIRSLVEMIRKIELYKRTTINSRILTNALLHQIIFDGVLKSHSGGAHYEILPFRARGHEFYKYQLVNEYFAFGENTLPLDESLSQEEICYLHNILSTSADTNYRGDEDITCFYNYTKMPVPKVEGQLDSIQRSDCPLMRGNLNTRWGTITAGNLVYGLNAGLQNIQIPFANIIKAINKTESILDTNTAIGVWISTIAADLGETILNQADENFMIGSPGFWNDSLLPTAYYLSGNTSDMTESKLLGGIDGLILASNIAEWERILMNTRFSQLIDMFYSNRGIAYNFSVRASNRNEIFNNILQTTNLTEQIIGTTNLLRKIGTYDTLLSRNDIEKLVSLIVRKFETLADDVTKRYDSVDHVNEMMPKSTLEIILIIDGNFDFYTSKRIIHSLSEALPVSFYGSKLGIINGENGKWISNITGEMFELFRDLHKSKDTWPTQLSLHHSLETVIAYYQNSTRNNCTEIPFIPLGKAIVLLSNNARPTNTDIYKSKEALASIKNVLPETNIIYVLSDDSLKYFQDLSILYRNDSFINYSNDILALTSSIARRLHEIPGQIVNIFCDNVNARMEDYLTPNAIKFYEVYEEYIRFYKFEIKFTGYNYGDIFICAKCYNASPNETCKSITVNDEVTFNSKDLCPEDSRSNLQFVMKVNNSKIRCAENDCRFPDQVRLGVTWTKSGSAFFLAKSAYLFTAFSLTWLIRFT
ncbi:hypothetical protein HHI36_023532 [Cryptolaemus montrouzieri]|uniref:Uncharacterized protein n=1 Tax=Cryptolaemus montrouzieri TaxID=559131 RepID=A0ABD2PHE8_9CUCU